MTGDEDTSAPSGWTVEYLGDERAVFHHDMRDLKVTINSVRNPGDQGASGPSYYTVGLQPTWLADEKEREAQKSKRVDTWDEAQATATDFMAEYAVSDDTA